MRDKFWETTPLTNLSAEQWERLCDGCGRCCLNKMQDEDTDELFYTALACQQLDLEACQCNNYPERFSTVPACMNVRELYAQDRSLAMMPASCAYRLRAQGKPLLSWHPLCSGRKDSVKSAGISVQGRVLSEQFVHERDWQNHIIDWIEL